MKIIFDNEEQKNRFMYVLSRGGCPSEATLKGNQESDCKSTEECVECWAHGIEMEVIK